MKIHVPEPEVSKPDIKSFGDGSLTSTGLIEDIAA
jgi:hypothetical protein